MVLYCCRQEYCLSSHSRLHNSSIKSTKKILRSCNKQILPKPGGSNDNTECNNHESFTSLPLENLFSSCMHRIRAKNGNLLFGSGIIAGRIYNSTGSGYGLHRKAEPNSVMTASLENKSIPLDYNNYKFHSSFPLSQRGSPEMFIIFLLYICLYTNL